MDLPRPELALVPRPSRISTRSGRFRLDATTRLRVTPGAGPAAHLLRTLLGPGPPVCGWTPPPTVPSSSPSTRPFRGSATRGTA
ncbi:hypothetical protein STENM223S_07437 [Streptomyces tendae]